MKNIKCLLGMHSYEREKQWEGKLGKRCIFCNKIKFKKLVIKICKD